MYIINGSHFNKLPSNWVIVQGILRWCNTMKAIRGVLMVFLNNLARGNGVFYIIILKSVMFKVISWKTENSLNGSHSFRPILKSQLTEFLCKYT